MSGEAGEAGMACMASGFLEAGLLKRRMGATKSVTPERHVRNGRSTVREVDRPAGPKSKRGAIADDGVLGLATCEPITDEGLATLDPIR